MHYSFPRSAALQVFSKGAKFSMFKPAEEMVYIGLDAESRTKGKAAIDVVGAQTGKSGGSVLQQVRLTGTLYPPVHLSKLPSMHAVAGLIRQCSVPGASTSVKQQMASSAPPWSSKWYPQQGN